MISPHRSVKHLPSAAPPNPAWSGNSRGLPKGFLDKAITILPALASDGLTECMVDSTGAAWAIRSAVPGMEIAGSIGLNVFNHLARDEISRVPFHLVTLSPELLEKR